MTKLKRKKPINVDDDDNDNENNNKKKATENKSKKKKTAISSDNNNNNNQASTLSNPKKQTAISGIVSMIDGQDYRKSIKYANYQLWEKQMKQRLISNNN